MTTVYRAYCKETEEVTEHASLPTLVEIIATTRLSRKFSDYDWFRTYLHNKTSMGILIESTINRVVMEDLFNTYRANKTLKDRVKLLTEPAEFNSRVTMVVDIDVTGINMIDQPYNPEQLLALAVCKNNNLVSVGNLVVDHETASDMFGDEVHESYDYEYTELPECTIQLLTAMGIEVHDEDLIDSDEVPDLTDEDLAEVEGIIDQMTAYPTVPAPPYVKVTVREDIMSGVRPTPRAPRKM